MKSNPLGTTPVKALRNNLLTFIQVLIDFDFYSLLFFGPYLIFGLRSYWNNFLGGRLAGWVADGLGQKAEAEAETERSGLKERTRG